MSRSKSSRSFDPLSENLLAPQDGGGHGFSGCYDNSIGVFGYIKNSQIKFMNQLQK